MPNSRQQLRDHQCLSGQNSEPSQQSHLSFMFNSEPILNTSPSSSPQTRNNLFVSPFDGAPLQLLLSAPEIWGATPQVCAAQRGKSPSSWPSAKQTYMASCPTKPSGHRLSPFTRFQTSCFCIFFRLVLFFGNMSFCRSAAFKACFGAALRPAPSDARSAGRKFTQDRVPATTHFHI